jgi:putative endopeptidase
VLRTSAPLLPKAFVEENFRFFGTVLTGQTENRPRWKRCAAFTDRDLGEVLGQRYVEQAFSPESKERMLRMVVALQKALERDIRELPWMTDITKGQALAKLSAIANKIGYPDQWRDYSSLKVARNEALGNSFRGRYFDFRRDLNKIGKQLDRKEWFMTPPTVNAYYSSQINDINFPAGILQPPFFDNNMDDAVNFGAIGAVIGHELTHGFDDQGSQFDAQGNLRNWWSDADRKAFEARTACFVDEYSAFEVKDPNDPRNNAKLNGKLTLGENTADNGGLRIAYMALLDTLAGKQQPLIDGYTPEQRVFLGWGQIWCQKMRPQAARMRALTDPHSPGEYRVNGVVPNMPEFQKAFSCKPDAPMVRANACRVW